MSAERILFLKFVGILKFGKIHEFLKFVKFEFSIYALKWPIVSYWMLNYSILTCLAVSGNLSRIKSLQIIFKSIKIWRNILAKVNLCSDDRRCSTLGDQKDMTLNSTLCLLYTELLLCFPNVFFPVQFSYNSVAVISSSQRNGQRPAKLLLADW